MRTYSSIVSDIRPADFDAIKQEYSNGSVGFADRVKAMGIAPSISEDDLTVLAAEFAEWPSYRGK